MPILYHISLQIASLLYFFVEKVNAGNLRVTAANVNDIEMFLALLDERDREIWADSGYASAVLVELLAKYYPDLKLHICEKGQRNHPLTDEQKANNREKSRIRARVGTFSGT